MKSTVNQQSMDMFHYFQYFPTILPRKHPFESFSFTAHRKVVPGLLSSMWTHYTFKVMLIEGSLEVKLPTIWTDEKQSREEAERRERLEERSVEEKESEERRCRCAKR